MIIKCWFSRSLQAHGFKSKHPSLKRYTAMMLNQKDQPFPEDVVNNLIARYGKMLGISEGSSYWPGA